MQKPRITCTQSLGTARAAPAELCPRSRLWKDTQPSLHIPCIPPLPRCSSSLFSLLSLWMLVHTWDDFGFVGKLWQPLPWQSTVHISSPPPPPPPPLLSFAVPKQHPKFQAGFCTACADVPPVQGSVEFCSLKHSRGTKTRALVLVVCCPYVCEWDRCQCSSLSILSGFV